MRLRVCVGVVACLFAAAAMAQESTTLPSPAPAPLTPSDTPRADEGLPPRLGRFRVGRVFLTPYFTIGQVGVDANVFFTQTGTVRDVTASGGPGLKLVLPLSRSVKLTADGSLNYLWFLEQKDQRRLMGNAEGRAEWEGPKFGFAVETRYGRSFERIDFEVDQRVDQTMNEVRVDARLGSREGGVVVEPDFSLRRYEVANPPRSDFGDVASALSRDEVRVLVPVRFKLTPKTWFVVEGEYANYGFLYDAARNGIGYRLGLGFELQSSTRLSGRVVVGPSVFRPEQGALPSFKTPWVNVNLAYAVGLKTSFESRYSRTVGFSGTSTGATEAPLRTNEEIIAGWTQRVVGRVGTRLWGGFNRFETVGEVFVPGEVGVFLDDRKDTTWQGGIDLTYEVAPKLSMGVGAYYTDRRSSVAAMGVEGLSFGVIFNYAGPVKVAFRP